MLLLAGFLSNALSAKKNVLLIIADDLNCNLGTYGHPIVKTPHIDRLADIGVQFQNAFCNFPVCGQSRASLMTGLYPEQNGVTHLQQLFRHTVPGVTTLSQHFMNHGYTAARVGKIYHYGNPVDIGTNGHDDPDSWDIRINPKGRDKAEEDKIFSLIPGEFGATLSWFAAEGEDEEQTDGRVATESIKLLERFSKSDEPFFLAVGFYKPHTPFVAPKKYFEMYDLSDIEVPRVPANYHDSLPKPAVRTLQRWRSQIDLPEETARKAIHAYYATISFLDTQVGRVVNALEQLGLSEDTIIVFTSDHGFHMGEHGFFQKTTLFEHADRVPFIISAPDMAGNGHQSNSLVELIDLYKTLSSLAGIPRVPEYVQGFDITPILDEPNKTVRDAAITQLRNGYSIRTKRYRYTKWNNIEGLNTELYDRLSDPSELINLSQDSNYQDVVASLDKIWQQKVKQIQTKPDGYQFIPADPENYNISSEKYREMEKSGTLPRMHR